VNTPILDILHIPLTAIRGVSPYDFLSRHETPVNDLVLARRAGDLERG